MIVNICRENCPLEVTGLPFLRLQGYEVCVRSIYAEFDEDLPNGYVTLVSHLVDRNNLNPNREIFSFFNDSYIPNIIQYTPINLVWYPLHSAYIDANTIEFEIPNSKVKTIKKLHLQLEFAELE